MGLDLAELVIDVEEEFGISLSDADAQQATTVGELIDLVERLGGKVAEPAPLETMFAVFRRALAEQACLNESSLEQETRSSDVFPWHLRHRLWGDLRAALEPQGYVLQGPEWGSGGCWLGVALCAGTVWSGLWAWGEAGRVGGTAVAVLVALVGFALGLYVASKTIGMVFTGESRTLGGLAGRMTYTRTAKRAVGQAPSRQELTDTVIRLVSVRLCIPIEDVKIESRFIEDLDAG